MGEFEREVIGFMGEIRQYMKSQPGRCASHSEDIDALEARAKNIEEAIGYDAKSDKTIHSRTAVLEKISDRVCFAFKAVAYVSSVAGLIYGGLKIMLYSVLPHVDKVAK